ncbi:hypothetical protein K438DRAFT_523203 [Mycena galopus ATCC 62051]|nr:hypothetical protein K438DRAFT_523203 [Mycena galopus ATCC 62051]
MFRVKLKVKVSISRKDSCKEQSWAPKPLMLVEKFKEEAKTKPISRVLRALGLRKKKIKTPLTKEYVYLEYEACAGASEPESSPSSPPSSRIPTFFISASSTRPAPRPAPSRLSQQIAVRKETSIVSEAAAVKTLPEVASKGSSVAHFKRFTLPANPAIMPSKRSQALRLRPRLRSTPTAVNSSLLPTQRPSGLSLLPRPRPSPVVAANSFVQSAQRSSALPRLRPRIHTSTPTTTLSVLVSQPSSKPSGVRLRPRFRPSTTTATPAIVSISSRSRLRPLVLCSVPATTSSSIPSPSPVPRARTATRSRIPVYVGRHARCTNRTALCGRASPSRVSKTAALSSVQPDAKVVERAHNSQTTASSKIMAELGTQTVQDEGVQGTVVKQAVSCQTVFGTTKESWTQTDEKARVMVSAAVQTDDIVADAAVQAHVKEPKTIEPATVTSSVAPPPPPPPPPPPVKATRTRIVVSKSPPSASSDRRPKHDSSDLMTELKERLARRESLGINLPALYDTPAPVSRSPSTLKSAVFKMRQFAKKGKENAAPRQEEESELQRVFQRKAAKAKSSAAGGRRPFGVLDSNTTTTDIPARRNKNETNRIAVQPLAAHAESSSVSNLFSSSSSPPPPPANPPKNRRESQGSPVLPQGTSVSRSSSNLKSAIQRIRQFVTKEKEDQEDSELQRVFRRKAAGGRRPFGVVDTNSTSGSSPDHAPLPRRRKLRRIVVPPLAEGSVPSTNPQIQSELERLRAQGKVGGGGGVGVRVRGVGGDSKTRKSYIPERTEN